MTTLRTANNRSMLMNMTDTVKLRMALSSILCLNPKLNMTDTLKLRMTLSSILGLNILSILHLS